MARSTPPIFWSMSNVFVMFRTIVKIVEFAYISGSFHAKTTFLDKDCANTPADSTETSFTSSIYSLSTNINVVRGFSIAKNIAAPTTLSTPIMTIHAVGFFMDYLSLEKHFGPFWGSLIHYGPELLAIPIAGNTYTFLSLDSSKQNLKHALDVAKNTLLPTVLFFTYYGMKDSENEYQEQYKIWEAECKFQDEFLLDSHQIHDPFSLTSDTCPNPMLVGDMPQDLAFNPYINNN
ncbi:MAG: hypothetical protein K0T99_02265 [Alphaproteobacteria bacterium]|nr:hypothetical protein [Alphaproteobacteria bacterium]